MNINAEKIIEQLMDLVDKLNGEKPITYEEALPELTSWPTNDPMESGFQAGLEYSGNLLREFIWDQLDDKAIRAERFRSLVRP